MTAMIGTAAITGVRAQRVHVEASSGGGLPGVRIVGLPDAAVREASDRVRAACRAANFTLPSELIVVNLAPAGVRKSGGGFDLPVVLAILAATSTLKDVKVDGIWAVGEVGLDGAVRPTPGTLPVAVAAARAGASRLFVAREVVPEARLVDGLDVVGVSSVTEAVGILKGEVRAVDTSGPPTVAARAVPDLADVRGQPVARRALEVAAAGGHHMLMVGPPGCGKSMLAKRLPGLLPDLTNRQALDVATVRSVAGIRAGDEALDVTPPFREPHHTTSLAGLIGGGSGLPRPGELSLAHHGVLFMDEFLETPRWILDALREPLENGRVVLNRAVGSITYPCRVQLIAATNPCPCGYVTSSTRSCRCRPDMVSRYRSRLSGPLLDRIDVQIELQALAPDELTGPAEGEPSGTVAKRVIGAREVAADRWGTTVARASTSVVRATAEQAAIRRLVRAVEVLGFSARAFDRCLRVARTIADIDGAATVGADQVDEAVAYRLPPEALR